MSPEEIAEQEDIDITSIKAILMQFSSIYRKSCKVDDSLNFTEDELVRSNQVIASLMQYAEDENLRFRAAKYIRDDKKGRLDAPSALAGLNVNVLMFDERLKKALEAKNRSLGLITSPPQPILANGDKEEDIDI